jgi:1-acyl-sn-glycerol-3-phosphate acyltransferase
MFDRFDPWTAISTQAIQDKIKRLDVPFGAFGYDRFGLSRKHLSAFYSILDPLYHHYFQVESNGIEHVPKVQERGMLVGNHSGGIPVDGAMVFASLFFDLDQPRHAHGMVEKFVQELPFLSSLFSKIGQLTGLPEHANQILNQNRLLLVFPEGIRGTGKMYKDRYTLARFGTGFMRIALANQSPIIPFAFVGGEEALPVIYHAQLLAKLFKVPYWPVPKHIIPIPKPVLCQVEYGAPLTFKGNGNESDEEISAYVEVVKEEIRKLTERGIKRRAERLDLKNQLSQSASTSASTSASASASQSASADLSSSSRR